MNFYIVISKESMNVEYNNQGKKSLIYVYCNMNIIFFLFFFPVNPNFDISF